MVNGHVYSFKKIYICVIVHDMTQKSNILSFCYFHPLSLDGVKRKHNFATWSKNIIDIVIVYFQHTQFCKLNDILNQAYQNESNISR